MVQGSTARPQQRSYLAGTIKLFCAKSTQTYREAFALLVGGALTKRVFLAPLLFEIVPDLNTGFLHNPP